jgi:hypothetical protein
MTTLDINADFEIAVPFFEALSEFRIHLVCGQVQESKLRTHKFRNIIG